LEGENEGFEKNNLKDVLEKRTEIAIFVLKKRTLYGKIVHKNTDSDASVGFPH
jgi:hypothetical protein